MSTTLEERAVRAYAEWLIDIGPDSHPSEAMVALARTYAAEMVKEAQSDREHLLHTIETLQNDLVKAKEELRKAFDEVQREKRRRA